MKEWIEIEGYKDGESQGDWLGLDKLTELEKRERVSRLRRLMDAFNESPEKRRTASVRELLEVPSRSGGSRWYLL